MKFDAIKNAVYVIQAFQKKLDDEKSAVLKEYFMRQPFPEIALRLLDENGLPKKIYIHPDTEIKIIECFSMIAPVEQSKIISVGEIIFSWKSLELLYTDI